MKKKFWMIEDHPLMLGSVKDLIEKEIESAEVVNPGWNPEKWTQFPKPELLILDLQIQGKLLGLELIDSFLSLYPEAPILVFSMASDQMAFKASMRKGVKGYCLKSEEPRVFIEALYKVLNDELFVSPFLEKTFIITEGDGEKIVTEREREVIEYIRLGLTSEQIAQKLGLSRRTVEAHRHNLMKKFGVHNVVALLEKFRLS